MCQRNLICRLLTLECDLAYKNISYCTKLIYLISLYSLSKVEREYNSPLAAALNSTEANNASSCTSITAF